MRDRNGPRPSVSRNALIRTPGVDGLGLETLSLVFAILALGGAIKGITEIGLPLIAVSAIASFTDVQTAVALIRIHLVAANLWHGPARLPKRRRAAPFLAGRRAPDSRALVEYGHAGGVGSAHP